VTADHLFLSAVVRAVWRDLRAAVERGPAAAGAASAKLILLDPTSGGDEAGEARAVTAVTTVGRAGDNALVLDDDFVSGHHAVIRRQDGAWWVADAGSTNGTWANEHRVDGPVQIKPGDTLRFGRLRARFEA
jgi:pSer/pThr/pTyr-binding forkhead associated (FHA) protein